MLLEHYQLAESLYGPELCGRHMRKFGIKYSQLHPQGSAVRDAFVAVNCAADWGTVLDRWYADDGPGLHPQAEVDETADCEVG